MKERIKKDKKFRMKIISAAAVLILLFGASVYTVLIKPGLPAETYVYKEETVARGNLILGIMESGSLSLGESSVVYELNLDLDEDEDDSDEEDDEDETIRYLEIEEVYVVSGQRMKEGDPLFSFTDASVAAVRRKLTAALAEAQITLSEAQTDYNISLLTAQGTYDTSITAGNRAQSNYQAALTKTAEEINSLEAGIKVLELEITRAQEMLADEDFLESYEEAKTAYTQAKNKYEETDLHNATAYTSNLPDYQEAESQLKQIEEQLQRYQDTITDNQEEIEKIRIQIEQAKENQVLSNQEAENTYQSARLQGEQAEEIYNYTTESLSDAVTQAQADLDELKERMDEFEAFVGEDNIVYAGEGGLVVNVMYEAGDDLINEGAILTYAPESDYTVSIDVSEEDIAAIKVGDQVDMVFTAYPDQSWMGAIVSITTSSTAEHATTISYPVTIHVEGDTAPLYGGMTADVTFVTDSAEDVLYVSKKAVFEEDGKQYVYRQTKTGGMEKAEVETGFSDMSSVEIISGLEEGDVIYIRSVMNTNEAYSKDPDNDKNTDKSAGDEQEFGGKDGQVPDMDTENFSTGDGQMPDMSGGRPNGSGFSGGAGGRQ